MSIYSEGDIKIEEILNKEILIHEKFEANCQEACEELVVALRNEFDFQREVEGNCGWTLTRYVTTFGAGPQPKRPAHYLPLPHVELVVYFDNPNVFKDLLCIYSDYKNLSNWIRQALRHTSKFQKFTVVPDQKTCILNFEVEVNKTIVFLKYAWEATPDPQKDFVNSTWLQALELLEPIFDTNWSRFSSLELEAYAAGPVVTRTGSARLAKYLREQPVFVKQLVILTKLWTASNILDDEDSSDHYISSLAELVAIKSGQLEMRIATYPSRYGIPPSMTRAFVQVLELLTQDRQDLNIYFDDVHFEVERARKQFQGKKKKYGLLLDPVNPYLNYMLDVDARSAWERLQAAGEASLKKFDKYQRRRATWGDVEAEFWKSWIYNYKYRIKGKGRLMAAGRGPIQMAPEAVVSNVNNCKNEEMGGSSINDCGIGFFKFQCVLILALIFAIGLAFFVSLFFFLKTRIEAYKAGNLVAFNDTSDPAAVAFAVVAVVVYIFVDLFDIRV